MHLIKPSTPQGVRFLRRPRFRGSAGRGGMFAVALAFGSLLITTAPAGFAAEGPPNTAIDRLDRPADTLRIPENASLQTVIRSGDRLIALGQRGVVIYSDDEGATWAQAPTPVSVALVSIAARPDGVVLAVGHDSAIIRSTDNGASWTKITNGNELLPKVIARAKARYESMTPKIEAKIEAARAAQAQSEAVAAAPPAAVEEGAATAPAAPEVDYFALIEKLEIELDNELFRYETAQGSMSYGPAWPLLSVLFLTDDPSEDRVLALGAFGTMFQSDDAGLTWRLVSERIDWDAVNAIFQAETDDPYAEQVADLHMNVGFVTKTGAVIIGSEKGMLFRAEAGAETFEPIKTNDGFSFFGIRKLPDSDIIIAYGFGDSYHYSKDDGRSWNSSTLSESLTLAGAVVLPSGGLGVMGDGGQMIEIGPEGEKRRFLPIDTRKFLGDAVPISGDRVLFVGDIGVKIATSP